MLPVEDSNKLATMTCKVKDPGVGSYRASLNEVFIYSYILIAPFRQ